MGVTVNAQRAVGEEALNREALITDVGGDVNILHIEDDPEFADLVATYLEQERDYFDVRTETDPRSGLQRLREHASEIDCIVSDYEMPEMDGLDVLRKVREEHSELPFVLFTGKGSEEIASEAISAGVTEYLQKAGGTEQYEVLGNRVEQAVARRRAEKQVQRGFKAIETASEGIGLLNDDGEFIYLNEAYADLLGYDRDELLGEHFEVLFRDDDLHFAYDEIIPTARDGEWRGQNVFVRKDGTTVPVDHALTFTTEETMICTVSEADDDVRETLSLRERAMNKAPVGITITNPDKEDNPIVYANDRFVELTEYSREEVMGRNCRFLQGERTRDEPVAELRRAIDAADPMSVELRNYRKDGEMFWNRLTIAPLFDEDDDLDYFVGFQEDVTARRELLEQFNSLGSVLSHDLQNPLQTVEGRLELAIDTGDVSHAEAAMSSVERLKSLINDVAEVLQTGTIVTERERVDVGEVAASVWRALDECESDDSIDVVGSPEVVGDRSAIRRLLDNLLGNSLEHGESPVSVRVGEFEGGFYVEDDGPGIPEENREKVFEQGFSTKDDDGGTGLGMTSVWQIALAHDWRIDITDAEELGGARFEIRTG